MLRVNWPVVDTIHQSSNKFVTGVKIKATAKSKLHDSLLYNNNCSDYIDTFCFYRLFSVDCRDCKLFIFIFNPLTPMPAVTGRHEPWPFFYF